MINGARNWSWTILRLASSVSNYFEMKLSILRLDVEEGKLSDVCANVMREIQSFTANKFRTKSNWKWHKDIVMHSNETLFDCLIT